MKMQTKQMHLPICLSARQHNILSLISRAHFSIDYLGLTESKWSLAFLQGHDLLVTNKSNQTELLACFDNFIGYLQLCFLSLFIQIMVKSMSVFLNGQF